MTGSPTVATVRRTRSAISERDIIPRSGRPRAEADWPLPVMYRQEKPACSIRNAESMSYAPGATAIWSCWSRLRKEVRGLPARVNLFMNAILSDPPDAGHILEAIGQPDCQNLDNHL